MQRRVVLAGAAALTAAALALPGSASGQPALAFNAPVLLTVDKYAGGYEPSITVDKFNNIFVTAHKQNHSLVLSPDSRAATKTRSQSWLWWSSDGKTFSDTPGLTPAQEQNYEFGDEGDLAADDAGHVYFVDTSVADNSFSRYSSDGRGKLKLDMTRPVGPFGEPVDDRPWIAAHGNGVVLYAGNQGDKETYPLGNQGEGYGNGAGPGRYTAYMSYDAGNTFDIRGVTLKDSGWCRPAADHRKGSKVFYVLCANDEGLLWSFVTRDDGRTWNRYPMGKYTARDPWSTYPSLAVAKDGTVYALFVDHTSGTKVSEVALYTSKDQGKRWTKKVIMTAEDGAAIRYSWIDVAPNGNLGIAYYYRPSTSSAWHTYAAVAKPGATFRPVNVAPKLPVASKSNTTPFGDFFQIAFGPDSKLNIAVTVQNTDLLLEGLNTDIYYIRQK